MIANHERYREQLRRFRDDLTQGCLQNPEQLITFRRALHYRLPKGVRFLRCVPNEHGEPVPVEGDYVNS